MKEFLRQSQVLTTFGPGAMVDLPDRAVLIEGLQSWRFGKGREEVAEPRLVAKLRERLGLPSVRLVKPPAFDERPGAAHASIGARIFPTCFLVQETRATGPGGQWRRRRLVRWSELERGGFIDDEERSRRPRKVLPVRFVCGCPHGHLDDIDWRVYAHQDRELAAKCRRRMWLEERGTSGDISETVVGCDCGIAPRPLYEALGIETRALGTCQGKRPWLGPNTEEDCKQPYRLLVRSASNAYFPQLFSVLSLPEEDPGLTARLDAVWNILEYATAADLPVYRKRPDVAKALDGLSDDEAMVLIERRRAGGAGNIDTVPVRQAEFEILNLASGIRGKDDPDSPFFAEALPRAAWDPGGNPRLQAIERVVLVHRLREVLALVGFTRFEAAGTDEKGELDLEGIIPAALSPEPEWFPAVENRGEGIFVVLSAETISQWRNRDGVKQRERQLMRGKLVWDAEHSNVDRHWLGGPYVLLHSLSHLLLTRIALDCGYPAAALRERIYALPEMGMYGLLIHTGTSDSEGTLGGLVETGRRIGEHLLAVIEDARLCSNDPVCAEHNPSAEHDPMHLHGAACHGCLLIAETSCEQRNDWLDRALVVPTLATADAAFFQ
jgi:hypothetical protein